jgi:hypothetical protein
LFSGPSGTVTLRGAPTFQHFPNFRFRFLFQPFSGFMGYRRKDKLALNAA